MLSTGTASWRILCPMVDDPAARPFQFTVWANLMGWWRASSHMMPSIQPSTPARVRSPAVSAGLKHGAEVPAACLLSHPFSDGKGVVLVGGTLLSEEAQSLGCTSTRHSAIPRRVQYFLGLGGGGSPVVVHPPRSRRRVGPSGCWSRFRRSSRRCRCSDRRPC